MTELTHTSSDSFSRRLRQAGALVGTAAGGVALVLAINAGLPASGSPTPAATPTATLSAASSTDAALPFAGDATAAPVDALAASASTGTARPGNGAVLTRRGSGSGRFTVNNRRGDTDAVVTLSRNGRATLVIYVRAGATATASRVPDGTFDVYVQQGRAWDSRARRFGTTASSGEFDKKAPFDTERTSRGIRYSIVTVTLQMVRDGNAQVMPVAANAIPA